MTSRSRSGTKGRAGATTGNEAQAKQAGTEECQGPRFRNRVAAQEHTPQTSRRELQGKHQIIEVVIGPGPGKSSQPK